ncbi:MAG: carboxypeptidase-like regulatory domain-containing protein, partial [Saprospiraceae bacterium]
MPKFSFLTLILILFFQITSNAQTIKGKITDKNGLPLAFVNIVLDDNPDEGIIADIDGNFSFKKNKNIKKLTLSYVGFETIDYLITEKDIKKGKI